MEEHKNCLSCAYEPEWVNHTRPNFTEEGHQYGYISGEFAKSCNAWAAKDKAHEILPSSYFIDSFGLEKRGGQVFLDGPDIEIIGCPAWVPKWGNTPVLKEKEHPPLPWKMLSIFLLCLFVQIFLAYMYFLWSWYPDDMLTVKGIFVVAFFLCSLFIYHRVRRLLLLRAKLSLARKETDGKTSEVTDSSLRQ